MLPIPDLPRNKMLALSLVQGLVLLLLWRALNQDMWPSQTPVVNFPLWTFTIAWPLLLLLGIEVGNTGRIFKLVSAFSVVLVLLAIYTGWQASPSGEFFIVSMLCIFIATMTLACFKALIHLQQRAAGLPPAYEVLFAFSWRNFLVAVLAAAFMLGVAALLALWGMLFLVIDIKYFEELFSKDWFLFPVLAVAFGIGVYIFRRLTGVIDSITNLLAGLMQLLLPLVILIMALFLAALPFTGLEILWETGKGTSLLLWLNAAVLFFINSVYQTGRQAPYPVLFQRLLCPGIALLPIVSALALYGLYLRIDQYGWTVARCWGLTTAVLLGMFSCGYLWGIIRRRWSWTEDLARVNIIMGWVVLALMLLGNSPLLDFRSISLASQLDRVNAGDIELSEFDFAYLERHLARPGYLEMQTLVERLRASHPELAERISRNTGLEQPDKGPADFWRQITFRPERFDVPPDLQTLVENSLSYTRQLTTGRDKADKPGGDDVERTAEYTKVEKRLYPFLSSLTPFRKPVLIQIDMNDDGVLEYVLMGITRDGWTMGVCFYLQNQAWKFKKLRRVYQSSSADTAGTRNIDKVKNLHKGEILTLPPSFHDLQVGGLRFEVPKE